MKKALSVILCVLMIATLFSGVVSSNAMATVREIRINEITCNVTITFSEPVDFSDAIFPNIYIANTTPEWQNIDGSMDAYEQLDEEGLEWRLYFTNGAQSEMSESGAIRLILDDAACIYDVGTGEPIGRYNEVCTRFKDDKEPMNKPRPQDPNPPVEEEEEEEDEVLNPKNFTDIGGVSWAAEAINTLAAKGIINGVSDTEFAPTRQITRADYMLILVRMLGLEADVTENFDDVDASKYYYKEIGIAKALGLTTGVGDNKFNPTEPITRQDMFVLAYRIMLDQKVDLADAPAGILIGFDDHGQIAGYAQEAMASFIQNELVQGSANMLNPKGNATRAETAVLVYRIYTFMAA